MVRIAEAEEVIGGFSVMDSDAVVRAGTAETAEGECAAVVVNVADTDMAVEEA